LFLAVQKLAPSVSAPSLHNYGQGIMDKLFAAKTEKSLDVIEEMDNLMKAANPGSIIGRTADGKEVYSHEGDPDQPADPLKKKQAKKASAAKKGPQEPEEEETDQEGEGSHGHHSARALAHLQAAQAHASAAHSAKKVDEAKEHKGTVNQARQMSEAAMASTGKDPMAKSMACTKDLAEAMYSSHSDVTAWAGQFYGTPLYVGALQCLKASLAAAKLLETHHANSKGWQERDSLSGAQRDTYEAQREKIGKPIKDLNQACHAQKTGLEGKLLDHKITQAQAAGMSKSMGRRIALSLSPVELRADLNKSISSMVLDFKKSDRVISKNNLDVNLDSEQVYLDLLEKGGELGGQAAGIREDGRQRLAALRGERLEKATIYAGENDAGGSRGGDLRETVARAQCRTEMIDLDTANNRGQGGLPAWFADSYNDLSPEAKILVRQGLGGPLDTGWQKGRGEGAPLQVIDDSDLYTRAVMQGGQPGEHQSALRLFAQGQGREEPK